MAERLRDGGAEVVTFDRDPEADVSGDISRSVDLDTAVRHAEERYGRLDVLVNSAGVPGESLRTVDVTDEEWERVLAINATAASTPAAPRCPG